MGTRTGGRGPGSVRQAPDVGRRVGAWRVAYPDRGDPGAGPSRHGPRGHPAGRHGGAFARCAGGGSPQGWWGTRRRAVCLGPVDRCRRNAGGPPARNFRPGRSPADGIGHQRRPRAHRPVARRVRPGRAHGAATGVVHPQRPACRRHHRHPRAAVAFRALLPPDLREGRSRPQEQGPRRRRLLAGLRAGAGGGGLSHPAAIRRDRHRRGLGREGGPRCRLGSGAGRCHLDQKGRLGRRDHPCPRGRRPLDPRPGAGRHPDPTDRTGDPRPGHRHRAGGYPRWPAQPVHRRRHPRGCPGLVELRTDRGSPPRRQGQALDEVHPADRPLADPARGHDPDHRGRQDRRRGGQRRALGRAGRRRAGHRRDLR
ncbi:Uncharacterised protein [Mycobacterium tuberculosis]|nr:Uncharacterised protein [Mycobacterium tuberculosis]CNY65924.1 Uncharacterised protein [Mycobacterium tuberculosis]CNY67621.1 Uncharacterised protein [Mycobacterium tuberculosis]CNY86793.1 Uncharacterised protein [Mycobacterium tuberculosis]CNY97340.1 Uncharacterised protein [Mycobacterium tuberculosis]